MSLFNELAATLAGSGVDIQGVYCSVLTHPMSGKYVNFCT